MKLNSTNIMLLMLLMMGIFISISSNSWLGSWIGLEVNLLSFIPLMSSKKDLFTTEASLKYFIVQAMASSILLFIVIYMYINKELMFNNNVSINILINTPLLLKSGAAPLHWWFPSVMEGLSWDNCLLLLTVQKIAPLMLISYSLQMNWFIFLIILISVMIGAIGGMNQTSIRKILTYSSINHIGWLMSSMMISETLWLLYFTIYTFLIMTIIMMFKSVQLSFINQTFMFMGASPLVKFSLFTILLSLGGLPPFMGFLPKWLVIQFMVINGMLFMTTIMIMMSLLTLYYYLRMCYSSFMINHCNLKWFIPQYKLYILYMSMIMSGISTTGLLLCTMIINIY